MLNTAKINDLMDRKGITGRQLAMACGVSEAHISYIKDGKRTPNLEITANLADALGVTVDELLRK